MNPEAFETFGRAFADLLKGAVTEIVQEHLKAGAAPAYATAKKNPLGSPRQFLDAVRRGAFPAMRVGREVRAVWSDVDAYVRSLPPPTRRPTVDADEVYARMVGPKRRSTRGK